jgi:gliding motility-associated protein GldM
MSSGGSPRQKMIGMMYLVLTALLALNVSKDVLNAFMLVNEGLLTTTENFTKKNEMTYSAFEKAERDNSVKVKPFHDKAKIIKKASEELIVYIDKLKEEIVVKSGGKDESGAYVGKDDTNIPAEILIVNKKGTEIKKKIEECKKTILSQIALVNKKDAETMKLGLDTEDPKPKDGVRESWESEHFEHIPMVAIITEMTEFQSAVKNAEADALNYLYKSVDAGDFKFDALVARVIAPTSYVLIGQEYTADVFVAAYSTTQNPQVLIDADTLKKDVAKDFNSVSVSAGMGRYKVSPTSEGLKKWGGVINVKSPDGTVKRYPFKAEFMAAKPSLTVSAEKMNVLYTGVENPISVSVPGVPAENLLVTITQGSIPGSKGKYNARVSSPGTKVKVNVSAKFGTETKSMGFFEFRVKKVPDPVATIASLKGGAISKGTLAVQYGIIPVLENFDFDLRFNCIGYEYTFVPKGGGDPTVGKGEGPLSPELKTKIQNCRPGSKVFFENIKVKGPDNVPRTLAGGLNFTLTN